MRCRHVFYLNESINNFMQIYGGSFPLNYNNFPLSFNYFEFFDFFGEICKFPQNGLIRISLPNISILNRAAAARHGDSEEKNANTEKQGTKLKQKPNVNTNANDNKLLNDTCYLQIENECA